MTHGIGLASAFRTLTVLPFPGKESEHASTTLFWFPVVGLVISLASLFLGRLVLLGTSALLASALVIAFQAYLTRAFHLDGLADMADGFGGGWEREQILRIMKDSHVGAFGVITVVLTLIVKIAALEALLDAQLLLPLLIVPILSRTIVVLQTVANPYARPEGGTAGELVTGARWYHAMVAIGWSALILVLVPGMPWLFVLWSALSGIMVSILIAWRSRVRIGGITGDLLGATAELSETAMYICIVFVSHLQ